MVIVFNKRVPTTIGEWSFMVVLQRVAKRCTYDEWVSGRFTKNIKFEWLEDDLGVGNANRSK